MKTRAGSFRLFSIPGRFRKLNAARSQITRPVAVVSLLIFLVALSFSLFPESLSPADPFLQSLSNRLLMPSFLSDQPNGHILGTDQLGRDLLSRIIYGARITLLISLSAVAISCTVGSVAGLVGGYCGGRIDRLIVGLIDMQLAFPIILLVISIVAVVGSSVPTLIVIMGLSGWPQFARVIRSAVISVRAREFIEAARSIGASTPWIITRHIAPNVISAVIVFATFELSRMILIEATLSFLGLGVQPPTPTWGGMISEGQKYISLAWPASFFPGLAIALTILAINMLGDLLRDVFDPHLADH